jgi:hypothetical protein
MASEAKAIFIMTNKFSSNPDEEDAKTILQQFSIQRYLRLHGDDKNESFFGKILSKTSEIQKQLVKTEDEEKKETLFCMQLIRPENKRHLVSSGTKDESGNSSNDLVVCLNEIKMGVIAKACIFPVSSWFFCAFLVLSLDASFFLLIFFSNCRAPVH